MSAGLRTRWNLRRGWVLATVIVVLFTALFAGVLWWLSRDQLEASVHRIGGRYRVQLDSPRAAFFNYLINRRDPPIWRWIDFEPSNVDDAWFREHRNQLGTNDYLMLLMCNTQITAQSLAELRGLRNVQTIDLTGTQLDDAAVEHLASLPNLKFVSVAHTGISDSALGDFSDASHLISLWIDKSQLTQEGAAGLAKCRTIRSLQVCDANDKCVELLVGLTSLETVYLRGEALSSASLPTLSRLQGLRWLILYDVNFSDSEIAELESALPGCDVVSSKFETIKQSREKLWNE